MRWRYLGLERPRVGGHFRLKDRFLASLGLSLGVLFLIVSWGVLNPLESLLTEKILGSLPDRIRVTAPSVSVGPVALAGGLNQELVDQVASLPNVQDVYRQAHFPEPCQLRAQYAGEGLVTDLVLELVDPGQVAMDVAGGYLFEDPGPGKDIPAIVPQAILDLVNSGISVNTNLPQLTASALKGKHFTLHLGTSSFRPGPARVVRCVVVGVSDQIGAGGPAIPYEVGQRLSQQEPKLHALTLHLTDARYSSEVEREIAALGLKAPRLELAQKVSGIAAVLRGLSMLLPAAVILVTIVGLTAILELQVSRERHLIALYRALGANRGQVGTLYFVRALSVGVLGFMGGAIGGLTTGRGLALWLESQIPVELLSGHTLFAPPWAAFGWSLVFCCGVTLAAGYLPAALAARVDPAQVFREPT